MVFTLGKGAEPPREGFLARGFEERQMELVSLERRAIPVPNRAYALGIRPVT